MQTFTGQFYLNEKTIALRNQILFPAVQSENVKYWSYEAW